MRPCTDSSQVIRWLIPRTRGYLPSGRRLPITLRESTDSCASSIAKERENIVKRLKKILKIGALVLGVLIVLLLVANAIFIWITGAQLEARLKAIRDAGDPVTLADLKRPMPPPKKNAATYLDQARDDVAAWGKMTGPVLYAHPPKPIAEQYAEARAAFKAYPHILPLLKQASECPECNLNLNYDLDSNNFLEHVLDDGVTQRFRAYANILNWQSRVLAQEGKFDDAMRWCLVSFHLAEQLQREPPILISSLVLIALRAIAIDRANAILRAGPVSKELCSELNRELAKIDDPALYQQAFKNERAYAVGALRSQMPPYWVTRGYVNLQTSSILDLASQMIGLTSYSALEAEKAFPEEKRARLNALARLLLPALMKVLTASDRIRAQDRCLRVIIAMQQKGLWKGDKVNIADLGLPAEVTTDPFDGSPIKIKKVDGQWLVYCVGMDLKDDGGKIEDAITDVGLGPVPADRR